MILTKEIIERAAKKYLETMYSPEWANKHLPSEVIENVTRQAEIWGRIFESVNWEFSFEELRIQVNAFAESVRGEGGINFDEIRKAEDLGREAAENFMKEFNLTGVETSGSEEKV